MFIIVSIARVTTCASQPAVVNKVAFTFPSLQCQMSDTYRIWCFVEGDNSASYIASSSTMLMAELKKLIKEEGKNGVLGSVDAKDLILWKVRMTFGRDSF